MNQLRLHGNPFGDDVAAAQMRSLLRLACGSGMQVAVALAGLPERGPLPGECVVELSDGVGGIRVGTRLPPAELELVGAAVARPVAATAPLVVFAPADRMEDAALQAGLAWPDATAVIPARPACGAADLLSRVRAELHWAGTENSSWQLPASELQAWLALPLPPATGVFVHVGCSTADGTDLVLDWIRSQPVGVERNWRFVLPEDGEEELAAAVRQLGVQVVRSVWTSSVLADATAVVLPWRTLRNPRLLVQALASGRPVIASRWSATAPWLRRPGCSLPVGGRVVPAASGEVVSFDPDRRALAAALALVGGDVGIGQRARVLVGEEFTAGAPCPPPAAVPALSAGRPLVVLEAPFDETSSSAELSIATAQALLADGRVDLQLVARTPLRRDLSALRQRAPELLPLFRRRPSRAALWLSSGWPVRMDRPAARCFAVRIDQEYGSLPVELTPQVDAEADLVVVHSEYVRQIVCAAGRSSSQVVVLPHGADASMHAEAAVDSELLAWKEGLPAVLFCGGLIWRKGFDCFLRIVLGAAAAGARFKVVIKSVGHEHHYRGYHLGELLARCQRTPGAPPILHLDQELTRAQLAAVYRSCDLLLHPYRGEGFGLPVLEARACGLPVLATQGGAVDALLQGPGAVALPARKRPVELPQPHVGQPWLLEPDTAAATRLLITALADLPALQAAARGQAATLRKQFAWSQAADKLVALATAVHTGVPVSAVADGAVLAPAQLRNPAVYTGSKLHAMQRQPEPLGV